MLKKLSGAAGIALAVGLVACSSGSDPKQSPTTPPNAQNQGGNTGGSGGMMSICPIGSQEVNLSIADTPNGVAVDIATSKLEMVGPLRDAVRHMAAMHGSSSGNTGGMMGGMMGGSGTGSGCNMSGGMMGGMQFPDSQTSVVDIEGGARLAFTPADPQDLDALRTAVKEHFGAMKNGQCPMMK